jgi:hypothetical protein
VEKWDLSYALFLRKIFENRFVPLSIRINIPIMGVLKEQYIEDDKGKKVAIILPIAEYKKMLEKLEELEDIRLYDEVKAKHEVADSFE